MVRFLIALFITYMLFVTVGKGDQDRASIPYISEQIVQLQFGGSLCSGTVVAKDLVLTAAHCIPVGDIMLFVQFIDGRLEEGKPVLVGMPMSPTDLALVKVDTKEIEPFPMTKNVEAGGQALYYVSMRETQQKIVPIVIDRYEVLGGMFHMIFRSRPMPGDSGAAIMNKDGHVVGIVYAAYVFEPLGAASLPLYIP